VATSGRRAALSGTSVVAAAMICEQGGRAASLSPAGDRRHIQDADAALRASVTTYLNLEMARLKRC